MVYYMDPEAAALMGMMMGGEPEPPALPVGPSVPTGIVPKGHCLLHPEVVLLSQRAEIRVTPGGVWSTQSSGPQDWCSQCDLEIEWARQRPHLEMVP